MENQKGQEGFTLVEVAVTLTSVALLALGVMLGFTTAGAQDRQSYEVTRAQNVCMSMMEQIESLGFEQLVLVAGAPLPFPAGRWLFTVEVTQLQNDLISIETRARTAADGSSEIRLVTLKSRRQEAL